MTDVTTSITISAALVAGLAGSVHCVAMCGGLAGALSLRGMATAASTRNWRETLRDSGLHHAGRLSGYAMAGALCGWLGVTLQSIVDLPFLSMIARIGAGCLLILIAARFLLGWRTLGAVERFGARFWRLIQPLVRRAASKRSNARNLLLGVLWGWLPCGLIYSMLVFAALRGDALGGAVILLAFGIGTLPAMLASSTLAARIADWAKRPGTHQAIGALLLIFGVWLAWAALPGPHHHGGDIHHFGGKGDIHHFVHRPFVHDEHLPK